MGPTGYKTGVFLDSSYSHVCFGLGFEWTGNERYLYVAFLFWELAIGRTIR